MDQPASTVAVIQTTWPYPRSWEAELHEAEPDHFFTNYSFDYYYVLREELERDNPGRRFVLTRTNEMLDYIYHDPAAPLDFMDLFRDEVGHMSAGPGRYLPAQRLSPGDEPGHGHGQNRAWRLLGGARVPRQGRGDAPAL